jgi:6,7-dimethyl-8-ribityllumazine synthase
VSPTSKGSKQDPEPLEDLSSAAFRFAIAACRFNQEIVDRLLEGALSALEKTGTRSDAVEIVRVPGAFELPLAAQKLAQNCDAVIALGCVIRGETPHFEYVSQAAAQGLERVSLDSGTPVGFGVLTTDNREQAMARAGGDVGNGGYDAAIAVIEMLQSLRGL